MLRIVCLASQIDLSPPPPVISYITNRSKVVLWILFSVFACPGVNFCTVFTFVCLDDI